MLDRSLVYDFWGHEVKLIDQFPIYELGGALRHLREIGGRETEDPFEQGYALWVAAQQLAKVIDGEQPLNFCRGAAVDLLAELRRAEQALSKPSDETVKPMAPWQFHGIRNKIDVFQHQLSAELKKTAIYSVPERGIFNIELLAENADRHIHESIRKHLSQFAVGEFKEAGRCLAFGLYSASGFHAARSVEDVLRIYYERFIGKPPDKPMGLLASNLGDLLEKKDALLRPRENTIRHIKDVTNFDRNPLIHRGVVLEEIDATTLFNVALGVIVEMVKELAALDAEGSQQLLPLPRDEPTRGLPVKKTKAVGSLVEPLKLSDDSKAS